ADLYFYRSRYYDPQIGRFTQRDKFNEAGFITGNPAVIYNPLQLNDYTYVGNNPLIYTDPWGFCKDRGFWTKIWDGDYVGTQFGAESTLMNAINYEQADTIAGKIIWGTAGIFSSLWTPENWKRTALLITTAGTYNTIYTKNATISIKDFGIHKPHHGLNKHIEIVIRFFNKKSLKIITPGKKVFFYHTWF
ncbi:MAG: RHS repeat-associated core domain-containing protein, partial [Candidatus Muiribacteriota bacterium]